MVRLRGQSLLVRLLGVYLLFVAMVLGTGFVAHSLMERQLRTDVQAADLALAQAIALDIDAKLHDTREALDTLSNFAEVRDADTAGMARTFQAFKAARRDIDRVYWLDPNGIMRVSVPENRRTQDANVSGQRLFQQAVVARDPVIEAGIVDLTTYNAVASIAQPVRDQQDQLLGVLVINLHLDTFSDSLRAIVDEQAHQEKPLQISMVDSKGLLVASPERERLLQSMHDELPVLGVALAGRPTALLASGPRGQRWLYSAVPVASSGWAVVVQRPASLALATIATFNRWLVIVTLLFALGGLLFWVELLRRVIRPLQRLAEAYQTFPAADGGGAALATGILARGDEMGGLARALHQLEQHVTTRFIELRTLLETSKVIVETLDPQTVAQAIIHEVQRLVDVQAAAVLVPDETGILRVLASEGRGPAYSQSVRVPIDDPTSGAAQALREGQPVQMVAGVSRTFPPMAFAEGFRALLAIPILSPHAGSVVLVVHRLQPQPFSADEVHLLMTFANYAALAWEHAVLYERSDIRLREEQQTLTAIMSSMSDGLVLASVDGSVLYTNPGAAALIGRSSAELDSGTIESVHQALRAASAHPEAYDAARACAESGTSASWTTELSAVGARRAIQLRLFDVRTEADQLVGRGLLLRDVTREQEIDQLKTALLAAVGHELRTPLAVIKMHASTLLQDDVAWSPAEQRQFVQDINNEADRLARLVSNLLDLSRLEAGLLQLVRAPYQLADLVEQSICRLHEPVPGLTIELAPALPPLNVDGPRIEVVLRNLLGNALAYGNGTVHISAEQCGAAVVVRVTDDGPGIAADELPHLFERFYRAARGQQRRASGIGLGLAICKAFIEAHGGRIWAESSAQGSSFVFSLPIDGPDHGAEQAAAAVARPARA